MSINVISNADSQNSHLSIRAQCSVYKLNFAVTSSNCIFQHGPRHSRCKGSGLPPSVKVDGDCEAVDAALGNTLKSITTEDVIKSLSRFSKPTVRIVPRSCRVMLSNLLTNVISQVVEKNDCLLYTSPSPRDKRQSRMPSSA